MLKFLIFIFTFQAFSAVYATQPLEAYKWNACSNNRILSFTEEDSAYTKAKLYCIHKTCTGDPAGPQHGITSPVGSPLDHDFIGDMLTQLQPFYATYKNGLESTNFQWRPLVLLEGGVGKGYFAQRFRSAFQKAFPLEKEASQPPFLIYILNEPHEPFHAHLNQTFQITSKDILEFKTHKKTIESHLFNPDNKWSYNFVVMHKVAHFWDPHTFALNFSKIHEKLALGGKIYLTLDAPDLLNPQTPFMKEYIDAHQRGDVCPGYFPGVIFNHMLDIDAIFHNEAPDDPESKLILFIADYKKDPSCFLHFKETLFDCEALKTTLSRLHFDVDPQLSFNYVNVFLKGLTITQACVVATKNTSDPDFSELLEQAKAESDRKSPHFNTDTLLKALPHFAEYCNEISQYIQRINRVLQAQ